MQQFRSYEDLESYINSGELNGKIKVQADQIYDYVEKNMVVCLGGVLNNILMRIQEYMKDSHMKKKDVERNLSSMGQDIKNREQELSNASSSYSRENQMLNEAERKKQNRLNSLGAQPDVKRDYYYTTEYYTEEVYRGGIGFWDWVLGPKIVTKSRQSNQIIENANIEIRQYKSQVDAAQNRVRSLKAQLNHQKQKQDQAQKDYEFYKNRLDMNKKLLEDLRKKANQELLEALRKKVRQQLEIYLDYKDGAIATVVREYIDQVIRTNKRIIIEKTEQFYDQRFDQMRRMYQDQIEGRRQQAAAKYGDYSEQLLVIRQMRRKLEHAGR